jgi:hypothetical protein
LPRRAVLPELPALFNQFIANYQHTFQWVTQDKRQQFADLLRQKESFFLYGAGFSYLFAEYLTKKLQVLGKTAFISGPGDSRNIFSATPPAIRCLLPSRAAAKRSRCWIKRGLPKTSA